MRVIKLSLYLSFLALFEPAYCQPPQDWFRLYDSDNQSQSFYDVYETSQGDFLCCGKTGNYIGNNTDWDGWIALIEPDGDAVWAHQFGSGETSENLFSIIETDNGDFISVGGNQLHINQVYAVRVSEDGEIRWDNYYCSGIGWAIIELKSGSFIIAGESEGDAFLLNISGEGEEIWFRRYEGEWGVGNFSTMREVGDDIIVAGASGGADSRRIWYLRADQNNGDVVWERYYAADSTQACYSMVSSGDGGFALAGTVGRTPPDWDGLWERDNFLFKINGDGDPLFFRRYDWHNGNDGSSNTEVCESIARVEGGGYALTGYIAKWGQGRMDWNQTALVTNSQGMERWRRLYDVKDEFAGVEMGANGFRSVINCGDGTLVTAGHAMVGERGNDSDGLLVKLLLLPELAQAIIISPSDTLLTVLPGDTVTFSVRVVGLNEGDLDYVWNIQADSLDSDTSRTVVFIDTSQSDIECRISFDNSTVVVRWSVEVVPMYISRFSPDTLNLRVHRSGSREFAIEERHVEGLEPEFVWSLSQDGNVTEIGHDQRCNVSFDRSGSQVLEALAFDGEVFDAVAWNIDVFSVLWDYSPRENQIEALVDDTLQFRLIPFDPEDAELEAVWFVDENRVSESLDLDYAFHLQGIYSLTGILGSGEDSDSAMWIVSVSPQTIEHNSGLQPGQLSLNAFPNPFNSSVTISFSVGQVSKPVRLAIYDLSGRIVAELTSNIVIARNEATKQSLVWDASSCPAGLYVVKMQSGDQSLSRKVILMR